MRLAVLLIIYLMSTISHNQTLPRTISAANILKIRVVDQNGKPLEQAEIIITKRKQLMVKEYADQNGYVSFHLSTGNYNVKISKRGYHSIVKKSYKILVDGSIWEVQLVKNADVLPAIASPVEEIIDYDVNDYYEKAMDVSPRMMLATAAPGATASMGGKTSIASSGLLTAGEWNDLHNWQKWEETLEDRGYHEMETFWNIYTDQRFSVVVHNTEHVPLVGIRVALYDNEKVLWSAMTDVQGKAELWGSAFGESAEPSHIEIVYKDERKRIGQIKTFLEGDNVFMIDAPCPDMTAVDIGIVIDATASMSDELSYLQAEMIDIIQNTNGDSDIDIQWSAMVYRDHRDAYLTKKQDFTSSPVKVIEFLSEQKAEGGGDYPEAVSAALSESIRRLSWRSESQSKLLFLLLDAPPHDNAESLQSYRSSLREAAAKGIKIIPISASGINRETEFLLKFTAILTNGTYTFLTDDSGIGGEHLSPVVESFEVETLKEILTRIINGYISPIPCHLNLEKHGWDGHIYPNPASQFIHIDQLESGDEVVIISPTGQVLTSTINQGESISRLDITHLVSGSYFVQVIRGNEIISKPILIIR